MNSSQVRAKARMAMKRREEEIEQEEVEGGELNLVPYLDIVTNIMLFLLATITSGFILGTINSALPEYADSASAVSGPQASENEPSIQLVVSVAKAEILVWSLSGLEGTLQQPKLKVPATKPGEEYDYKKITDALSEIVKRRYANKPLLSKVDKELVCLDKNKQQVDSSNCRSDASTEVIFMADGEIPYHVIVKTLDAMRQHPDGTILFPNPIPSTGIQ